jgi:hypothetical protein
MCPSTWTKWTSRICVEATLLAWKEFGDAEDQIAHWKAQGEMTTRDILARMQELGDDDKRRSFPSLMKEMLNASSFRLIDRDFSVSKKDRGAESGFGFVDFENHLHALACLRELNITRTSLLLAESTRQKPSGAVKRNKKGADIKQSDFVGKDGKAKLPRLVVEFAVETW